MRINHNITDLNTYNQMNIINKQVEGELAKLSSGLRINQAADDAPGRRDMILKNDKWYKAYC